MFYSSSILKAGITRHPIETWMEQMARNVTDESTGCLRNIRYVLHDRDTKFCASFRSIRTGAGSEPLKLPARSPTLNAFAEWLSLGAMEGRGLARAARPDFVRIP